MAEQPSGRRATKSVKWASVVKAAQRKHRQAILSTGEMRVKVTVTDGLLTELILSANRYTSEIN